MKARKQQVLGSVPAPKDGVRTRAKLSPPARKGEEESPRNAKDEPNQGLLASIVDSSDDAIISKSLDGVITSWNKSAVRLFGYSAEEAIGRRVTLIIPPERLDEETEILEKLRRGERFDHFETVRMRKDGTKFDVSLTISPVKDSLGRVIGASKVARDISERKSKEQALAEKTRLLDLSYDAILVRDAADRITFWNKGAAELYGYTHDEAIGRVSHELLATEFPEPLERISEKLLVENRWNGELIHRRKDRSLVVVLSRWVLDRDEQGNPRGVLETNNDITEQRLTAEALRSSEERLQTLTVELEDKVRTRTEELRELWNRLVLTQEMERRSLARELHDSLGQYLAALNMVLDSARDESPNGQRLNEAAEIARTCIKEVRTISHLLHPPLLEETGIASAAAWYIEGFATRSGIHVEADIDRSLGRLPTHVELVLFRVLQESLTNVHRHSGTKTVAIRICADAQDVRLEIKDEGRGIAAGARPGVGIQGMRERVENLGGELQVESNGGGTRVRAVLPLVPSPEAASAEPAASPAVS